MPWTSSRPSSGLPSAAAISSTCWSHGEKYSVLPLPVGTVGARRESLS